MTALHVVGSLLMLCVVLGVFSRKAPATPKESPIADVVAGIVRRWIHIISQPIVYLWRTLRHRFRFEGIFNTFLKFAVPISIVIASIIIYLAITLPYRNCVNSYLQRYNASESDAKYYCSQGN